MFSVLVVQAWNHLATGMGGIEWRGVPAVCELLGIPEHETELLVEMLAVIKRHKPPRQA